ncbi:hypothetical protein [Cellulomonas timonensis]|uniref:hypothetical protein n=1 Tax=Cellulomonas timonensis TaxID=1689271 RepID=UPI00082D227E|nr:hypothetical protein [Cellulomonas timonensis]
MGSGIQPYAIPGADFDPDAVLAAANALRSGGGAVRDAGADVVSTAAQPQQVSAGLEVSDFRAPANR